MNIITTTLPSGVVDVPYSQTIQVFGGQAPLTFAIDSGGLPAGLSLDTGTGVISGTPSVNTTSTVVIEVTDDNSETDTQEYTIQIYDPLVLAPEPNLGDDCVIVATGSQVQFSATGGSGTYQFTVDGGNMINPSTGLLTAVNGGSYTVTVTDTESGQVTSACLTVTSQAQFCVHGNPVGAADVSTEDTCCEFNVECGDRLQLKIPSFHIIANGEKVPVVYGNLVQAITGDGAALQSTSSVAGATGNAVSFNRNAFFEIVTSYDMAQTTNGEFGIGWSPADNDATIDTIAHAVVWYTDTGERLVEIRHSGAAESGSQFPIAQGDAVSFGVVDGELQLWINSVLVYTSEEDFAACGDVILDIGMGESGKTIGGYVTNLAWSIVTAGNAGEVGTIDANGIYTSPQNPLAGVIKVKGTVNNADFYVNIRNIQPTPKFVKPQPFLAGRRAHVWVTNKRATDNEVIRIASDGSPDALQNPNMIYLGVLEGSAKFTEEITYQTFENDEGAYFTAVASEKGTLTGSFLEVRDLDKLAVLMQHSTLFPESRGVKELGVGGKTCGSCDLRAVLIVESGVCGSGWDVIYFPRVQNNANLSLEIGKKVNAKYELNFAILTDPQRPAGKQLYSIYPNAVLVISVDTVIHAKR